MSESTPNEKSAEGGPSDDETTLEGAQPAHDEEKDAISSVPSSSTSKPPAAESEMPPPVTATSTDRPPTLLEALPLPHSSTPPTRTMTQEDDADGPPPLPYSLREHKLAICIFWFLIIAECCFIPLSFYYGLWFGTTLNHGALFAIITSVFGFITGYEYTARGWLLLLARDTYRPLFGAKRFWGFDTTQWLLVAPYTVMTGVLIGFSIPSQPLTRGLALPMALGMIILGGCLIASGYANRQGWCLTKRFPRLGSHVIGDVCPPLTYCIVEDVVAVDGRAGKPYREALLKRYKASPRFREMLMQLLWFWAVPAVIIGIILVAIIYVVKKEVAYGLGWGVPALWAGTWAVLTTKWVQRSLRIEKECWKTDRSLPP